MNEPTNITPFRRRPQPPKLQGPRGFDPQRPQHKALLMHALTAAAFLINWAAPFPGSLIGLGAGIGAVAIAQSNRREGMPWAQTHHEFGIRTLLLGAAVWVVSGLLIMAPAPGVATAVSFIQLLVLAWVLARAAVGFWRALNRKPTPNPLTPFL
jgi:uncharacterized membrane protein